MNTSPRRTPLSLPNKPESTLPPIQPPQSNIVCSAQILDLAMYLIHESDRFRLREVPYPGIEELAADIQRKGQSTPLFVRPGANGQFELISGYCRRAALEKIGAATALCRIYNDLSDAAAYDLAICENQGRNNLTDLERATICLRLHLDGHDLRAIAERMGWTSERNVQLHLRLARRASPSLRAALKARTISFAIAGVLVEADTASLGEAAEQVLISTVVAKDMSVRELRRHIAHLRSTNKNPAPAPVGSQSTSRYLREYKNGAFTISARIDPKDTTDLDRAIAAQEDALRRSKQLRRKVARGGSLCSPSPLTPSALQSEMPQKQLFEDPPLEASSEVPPGQSAPVNPKTFSCASAE